MLFLDTFPFRLLHNVECSSLCSTEGPCWASKIEFYVSIFSITIQNRTHSIMSCHVLLGHFSHTIWSQYLIGVCFVWLVHADVLIVEFHILIFLFLIYLFLAGFIFFYSFCMIALHLNLKLNRENIATTVKSLVQLCNACIVL